MSISSIGQTTSTSELARLRALQAAQSDSTDASSASGSSSDVSTSVGISKPAQEMKKLAALQQSDPAKFKEVVSQIADQLSQAASSQTGAAADKLNEMADKFEKAADSGDLSSLQPPAHKGGGGGHHAHAAYAQNARPPAGADAVKSAMDSAFDLIDQATSSSSAKATSTDSSAVAA